MWRRFGTICGNAIGPVPVESLLEAACLAPGFQRGIRPPLDCLDQNRGGFSARRLKEAAGFLGGPADAILVIEQFSSQDLWHHITNRMPPENPGSEPAAALEFLQGTLDDPIQNRRHLQDGWRELTEDNARELLSFVSGLMAIASPCEPVRDLTERLASRVIRRYPEVADDSFRLGIDSKRIHLST